MPTPSLQPRPGARRRRLLAGAIALTGFALLCIGLALVYVPAGLIVAGGLLLAAGLFVIDVGGKR